MPRQKYHRDRVYQIVGEPGPGSIAIGYVRYSSELQDPTTIATQKRRIQEFADKKGWRIVRWFEEPEQSAKYEEINHRPVFAQVLSEAGRQFQIVLCYMNNRWSRNVVVAYTSLTRLRQLRVWWATADGLWDIDKVQQDGFDVAFAVDTQINASYVRQLSKRTIDGKEDRAREGYHNGNVMFGYLPPEYPKAPDGAPSTWRPPRMPARPDPILFPVLVRIGELVADGWADRAIADELEGYNSVTARFGERALTKDTIAAIRRSWFPREFAQGCGHGTVDTPSGDQVEGKHPAAWPFELWQRMIEVKASQYRRPTKEAQKRPHEFSRIIVCAACRRPLRVTKSDQIHYYSDTSLVRKLECAASGSLTVRSGIVIQQFGEMLRSIILPDSWRQAIAERCMAETKEEEDIERVRLRRAELEAEQKRLVTVFTIGFISEEQLDVAMERIRAELFTLPMPVTRSAEELTRAALSAGETLENMADYWNEATAEERRDMVWSLLNVGGLIFDLERRVIVGILPRESFIPVMSLGLEATARWEQRSGGLWLCEGYWPEKLERSVPHILPPQAPSLTLVQQEDAVALLQQGWSIREVAQHLGASRGSIHRLARKEGVQLQDNGPKLTPSQQEEAMEMLRSGASLRKVAERFGINHESVRRMIKRKQHEEEE